MIGSDNMVAGDVWVVSVDDTTGAVLVEDRWSTNTLTPSLDLEYQDLFDATGYQNTTHTIVSFSRALVTPDDERDWEIVPGPMKFAWAMGSSDVFRIHNVRQGGLTLDWMDVPTGPPSAPRNFRLEAATDTTLELSWEAPAEAGAGPVLEYVMEIANDDEFAEGLWFMIYSGLETIVQLSGLEVNTNYNFRLVARNIEGWSLSTEVLAAGTIDPNNILDPEPPALPVTTQVTETSISVSWLEPELYGFPLDSFVVEMAVGVDSEFFFVYQGLDKNLTIVDLPSEEVVFFRVLVLSVVGISEWSEVLEVRTTAFNGCQNDEIDCNGHGVCIEGTCICDDDWMRQDCGLNVPFSRCWQGQDFCLRWDYDDQEIHVKVSAVTSGWAGLIVGQPGMISTDGTPGDMWIVSVDDLNGLPMALDLASNAHVNPELDLVQDLRSVHGYYVDGLTIVGFSRKLDTNDVEGADEIFVQGIPTPMGWAVSDQDEFTSMHTFAEGGIEVDFLQSRTPSSPPGLQAQDVQSDMITMTWNEPSSVGVSPVTSYTLQSDMGIEGGTWRIVYQGAERIHTITNLQPVRSYTFRVAAENAREGLGVYSEPVSVVTLPPLSSLPAAPGAPVLSEVQEESVWVSWEEPDLDEFALLYYELQIASEFSSWALAANTTDTNTTLTDLMDDTQYKLRLRAVSVMGVSAWSSEAMVTTLAYPPCPGDCNEQGACIKGKCQCKIGSVGLDCAQNAPFTVCTSPPDHPLSQYESASRMFENLKTELQLCLHWSYDTQAIHVQVVADVTGWVALSFGGLGLAGMTNADLWLGWVDNNGQVYMEDRYSEDHFTPVKDTKQDLMEVTGYENIEGQTILSFSRYFSTGDFGQDVAIGSTPAKLAWAWQKYMDVDLSTGEMGAHTSAGVIESFHWRQPRVPAPPSELKITGATASSIECEWSPPITVGVGPVIAYLLELEEVETGSMSEVYRGLMNTAIVEDLEDGKEYRLRVSAENMEGYGAWSNIINVTLSSTARVPDVMASPQLVNVTSTSISINWTQPELYDSALLEYVLEMQYGDSPGYLTVYRGTDMNFTQDGFEADDEVQFRVRATTLAGVAALWSPANTVMTLPWPACPEDCSQSGECVRGQCQCNPDSMGMDCSQLLPFKKCLDQEDKFCLYWNYDNNNLYVSMQVETLGWAGLMVGGQTMRSGADTWVVWIDDTTGRAYAQDRHTGSHDLQTLVNEGIRTPTIDPSQDLISPQGYQVDSTTVVAFIRPLSTGETIDTIFAPGMISSNTQVNWAIGESDNFVQHVLHGANDANLYIDFLQSRTPSPPLNLTLVAVSTSSVELEWLPPATNGVGPVTLHLVQQASGTGGNASWFTVYSGPDTAISVGSLMPRSSYLFRVSARNVEGAGAWSQPLTVMTSNPAAEVPEQMQPVETVVVTQETIDLIWTEPNLFGEILLSYEVQMTEAQAAGGTVSEFFTIYSGTDTSFTVKDLQASSSYRFRVRAVSSVGPSQLWSLETLVTTLAWPVCADPTCNDHGVCDRGICRCEIGWLGDNCEHALPFEACNADPSTGKMICLRWRYDNEYLYAQVESEALGWSAVMYGADVMAGGGDLWIVYVDDTTGEVHAEDRYSFQNLTPPKDAQQDLIVLSGIQTSTHTIVSFKRKLETGDTTRDRLIVNQAVPVAWSFHATSDVFVKHTAKGQAGLINFLAPPPEGPPSAPEPLVASMIQETSVLLTWNQPRFLGVGPVLEYVLQRHSASEEENSDNDDWLVVFRGISTEHLEENLVSGALYKYRVYAVNAAGDSPYSNVLPVSTLSRVVLPPNRPNEPTVVGTSPTSIGLAWTFPETRGAAVSSVTIEFGLASSGILSSKQLDGTAQGYLFSDLEAKTLYAMRMKVTTVGGDSPWSSFVQVMTDAWPACPNDCSEHGTCFQGTCRCEATWLLEDCSLEAKFRFCDDNEFICAHWTFDATSVYVQIEAETTGWAALLLGSAGMVGAGDVWLVWVNDTTGEAFAQDRYSSQHITPSLDTQQDLTHIHGYQTRTTTMVSFQRLLITTDTERDIILTDGLIDMGWSMNKDTDNFVKHTHRQGGLLVEWLQEISEGPPSAPRDLRSIAATETSVTLSWLAPEDEGAGPVSAYVLQQFSGVSRSWIEVYRGQSTSFVLMDLVPAQSVTVRVAAMNTQAGMGDFSDVVQTTSSVSSVAPSTPSAPALSQTGQNQISLAWTLPDLHGQMFLAFTLQMKLTDDTSNNNEFISVYTGPNTAYVVNDLDASTSYSFRILVSSLGGVSPPGVVLSVTTLDPLICIGNCHGHGECVEGSCQCASGYLGVDCSQKATETLCPDPDFCLSWVIMDGVTTQEEEELMIRIVAKTTGWAGLIVGAEDGIHEQGDTWLVWVDDWDGTPYVQDRWSVSLTSPRLDKKQDLKIVSGYQTLTHTSVTFTRPLITTDVIHDIQLPIGESVTLAWAISESDAFQLHQYAGGNENVIFIPTNGIRTTMSPPLVQQTTTKIPPISTTTEVTTIVTTIIDNNDDLISMVPTPVKVDVLDRDMANIDAGAIELTWTGIKNDKVEQQVYYIVEMKKEAGGGGGDTEEEWMEAYKGTETSIVLKDLLPSQAYEVRMAYCVTEACTQISPYSLPSAFTTLAHKPCKDNCNQNGICTAAGICLCSMDTAGPSCEHHARVSGCFGKKVMDSHTGRLLDSHCLSLSVEGDSLHATWALSMPSNEPDRAWAGLILGAADGMIDGDAWIMRLVTDDQTGLRHISLEDRWSSSYQQPILDPIQDLIIVGEYINTTHAVVHFQRALAKSEDVFDMDFTDWAVTEEEEVDEEEHDKTRTPPGRDLTPVVNNPSTKAEAIKEEEVEEDTEGNDDEEENGRRRRRRRLAISQTASYDLPLSLSWAYGFHYFDQHRSTDRGIVKLAWKTESITTMESSDFVMDIELTALAGACGFVFLLVASTSLPGLKSTSLSKCLRGKQLPIYKYKALAMTYGELCLLVGFIMMTGYYGYYVSEQLKTANEDTYLSIAHVALINLVACLLPITRNSVWSAYLRISYERSQRFHVVLSCLFVLVSIAHGVTMVIQRGGLPLLWSQAPYEHGQGSLYGTASLGGFILMFFCSLPMVRKKFYELFIFSHFLFCGSLAVLYFHYTPLLYYLAAPFGLYVLDLVLRMYHTYSGRSVKVNKVECFSSERSEVTKLTLQASKLNYKPGQHMLMKIPAISSYQWHPVSISSAPHQDYVSGIYVFLFVFFLLL